jgi:hypothetical protein
MEKLDIMHSSHEIHQQWKKWQPTPYIMVKHVFIALSHKTKNSCSDSCFLLDTNCFEKLISDENIFQLNSYVDDLTCTQTFTYPSKWFTYLIFCKSMLHSGHSGFIFYVLHFCKTVKIRGLENPLKCLVGSILKQWNSFLETT